jgi:hypothetical protein
VQALELNPSKADAYLERARCFLKMHYFSSALVDAEASYKTDNSCKRAALCVKAQTLRQLNKAELALKVYNQVLDFPYEKSRNSKILSEDELRECRKERSRLVRQLEGEGEKEGEHKGEGEREAPAEHKSTAAADREESLMMPTMEEMWKSDGNPILNKWVTEKLFDKQVGVLAVVVEHNNDVAVRALLSGPIISALLAGTTRVTQWSVSAQETALNGAKSSATRKAQALYSQPGPRACSEAEIRQRYSTTAEALGGDHGVRKSAGVRPSSAHPSASGRTSDRFSAQPSASGRASDRVRQAALLRQKCDPPSRLLTTAQALASPAQTNHIPFGYVCLNPLPMCLNPPLMCLNPPPGDHLSGPCLPDPDQPHPLRV